MVDISYINQAAIQQTSILAFIHAHIAVLVQVFDEDGNGVIDFHEYLHTLSVLQRGAISAQLPRNTCTFRNTLLLFQNLTTTPLT